MLIFEALRRGRRRVVEGGDRILNSIVFSDTPSRRPISYHGTNRFSVKRLVTAIIDFLFRDHRNVIGVCRPVFESRFDNFENQSMVGYIRESAWGS